MISTEDLREREHQDRARKLEHTYGNTPRDEPVEAVTGQVPPPPRSALERLTEKYVERAMLRSLTKRYEDGSWFAEISIVPNVWGYGRSEEEALGELESVLRDWIEIKIMEHDGDIPVIDSINLNVF